MEMEASDLTQLSEELIHRLDSEGIGGMMSSEMFEQSNLYMDDQDVDDNEPDDVIILHMDIREPLRNLQKLVEQKICHDLKGYKFWLQDAQELEPHKNLVDQCVKGEGLVQINVQIQTINLRINIVDVLKPTEAALVALAAEEALKNAEAAATTDDDHDMHEETSSQDSENERANKTDAKAALSVMANSKDKPCLNWVLDSKFKKEQVRLKIPEEPNAWTVPQVKHWFQWAVRQFDLTDIVLSDWAITGKELCALSHEEFRKKLPNDPGNVFWTHLQLLKECKFVSVVHKAAETGMTAEVSASGRTATTATGSAFNIPLKDQTEHKIMRKPSFHKMKSFPAPVPLDGSPTHIALAGVTFTPTQTSAPGSNGGGGGGTGSAYGVGSGNNGQVQLWQFLLEILTDREHVDIIQWVGTDGEFKLTDPERVARLWGEKKNKPAMNYEKLSRALRYYYDGDMISKVSGKRFAYKFDCDLKLLIGYDAAELSKLVNEKSFMDESVYLEHLYVGGGTGAGVAGANAMSDDE